MGDGSRRDAMKRPPPEERIDDRSSTEIAVEPAGPEEVSVPNDLSVAVPPPVLLTSKSPGATDDIFVRPGKPPSKRKRSRIRLAYKWLVGASASLAMRIVSALLPFGVAQALGRFGGRMAWLLRPSDRSLALENLAIALPEKSPDERFAIAKESFARVGKSAMEWVAVRRIEDRIGEVVEIVGREHLEAAFARKKGVIWINAHISNWELMAAAVSRAGYPCNVIATTVRYAALNRWTIEKRGRYGVHTIERESPASGRELLRVLRNNEVIGILADHDTKVPSVQVDFFGRPAWTAIGVAELVVRLGASMVSGFMEPVGPRKWRVVVSPPIFPPENVPKREQLRHAKDLTQLFTKATEDHIRAHPEDWAWMHRRWK